VHESVRNDGACVRCGWTAPGPVGDARLDAQEAVDEARARAELLGWEVIEGGPNPDDESLAA
jgi:hypothetical protein